MTREEEKALAKELYKNHRTLLLINTLDNESEYEIATLNKTGEPELLICIYTHGPGTRDFKARSIDPNIHWDDSADDMRTFDEVLKDIEELLNGLDCKIEYNDDELFRLWDKEDFGA